MNQLRLFRAGISLAERLPPSLLYAAADVAGLTIGRLPLPAQRDLAANLSVVMGLPPAHPRVRRAVAHATRVQAANYVDLFRSRAVTGAAVARRFVLTGPGWALFDETLAQGRGAVLVSAHLGRFELLSHYLGHLGYVVTLPVERLHPPELFDLVRQLRQRPTFQLVPHDAALRPALRALGRGEVVAFFADWDPSGQSVLVEFFGRRAHLPGGPAFVARRAGAPLFVGFSAQGDGPGQLAAYMEPPLEVPHTGDADADVRAGTQMVAALYERHIRARPDQWVMFHRIWT